MEVDIVIGTFRQSCIQTKPNLLNKHCCSQTVPGQPSVSVDSTTATTISLSWSVPSGSVVTSYVVMWQRDTSACPGDDEGSMSITDGSTSYMITELEEDSSYSITVTAVNAAGTSAVSNAVTARTREAGEILCVSHRTLLKVKGCFNSSNGCFRCSSIRMLCACFLQPAQCTYKMCNYYYS